MFSDEKELVKPRGEAPLWCSEKFIHQSGLSGRVHGVLGFFYDAETHHRQ
jgi:hypothetical protein